MTLKDAIQEGCLNDPDTAFKLFKALFDKLDDRLDTAEARLTALEKK
jgi:uncharacterized protein (DUF2267 family)